ncbi:hypothetical protein BASA81_000181 [Batrachochytrium salamandrivorans]|nr:hypothetical protein BASA81_000181 [Batrachochytrium salamandrivorans]
MYVEQLSYNISEARWGCWAGSVVWPAALFLGNYLAEHKLCLSKPTVLELGSGMGVPGIVAGCLGAKRVILTEQSPLDELLGDNIRKLFPDANSSPYQVMTLDWNECEVVNNGEPVDLLLISDCIFTGLYGDSWKLLASVVNVYLQGQDAICLNSVERRCVDDGVDEFIAYCLQEFNIHTRLVWHRARKD